MNHYKPIYCPPLISSFLLIDIQKIFRVRFSVPLLDRITRSQGIELLAELLGMYDLETNIISYWTVDVLSQVIRKCQSKSMKEDNIKMSILWIHYILYTIHKNHPTRKKLFKHLCIMFNRAMQKLPEIVVIPHPYNIKNEIDKSEAKKNVHDKKK
nr:uncharacterized protein LOC112210853 [Halyomorpha halys]